MNIMNDVIQIWLRTALWCALLIIASNPSATMARSHHADARFDNTRIAFLSGSDNARRPAEEAPGSPQQDSRNFDGAWIFTSAGCPYTGSLPAKIVGGKIIIRGGGGQVDPDGTLHSVGAGNGMTLTATGQLSGDTGSGTFNRSDGCAGTWVAIKRATLRRRRP
jgi:hypothetical protein